jgi:hypothetical protein
VAIKKFMGEDELNELVYSKNVIEFVTVANEYCGFIENIGNYTTAQALSIAQKILPLVYLKATLLPEAEKIFDEETEKFLTEIDYNILLQRWLQKLGEHDSFREIFNPGQDPGEDPLESSISENLIDIYQPVKNFISAYSLGDSEVMNDALSECVFEFREYWGQRLVNALRAIHLLIVSDIDFDEGQKPFQNSKNKGDSGWVDGFFDRNRDSNF